MKTTEEQLQQMAEEYATNKFGPAGKDFSDQAIKYSMDDFIAGFKKCRELLGQDSATKESKNG